MSPNTLFLQKVTYLSDKRQIVCEFASHTRRFSKRYAFFPSVFLPRETGLEDFLSTLPQKDFSFQPAGQSMEVFGATMDCLLELIHSLSEKGFGKFVLFSCARQFLLRQGWSYFDVFSIEGDSVLRLGSPVLYGSEPIKACFSEKFFFLKSQSEDFAKEFLEKMCLSNMACIPPSEITNFFEVSSEVLYNWFYKNNFPLNATSPKTSSSQPVHSEGFFEFDFSFSVSWLASMQNFGADSLNCSCCMPASVFDENVLLSSQVKAEFLVNGFYFQPKNPVFAKEFHDKNAFKKQRIEFQNEWCLPNVPAGPFFKGQKATLPFGEFKKFSENTAMLAGTELLFWHCRKKSSFAAQEVKKLFSLKNDTEKILSVSVTQNADSTSVLFFKPNSTSFGHEFLESFHKTVCRVLASIPLSLSDSHLFGEKNAAHFDYLSLGVLGGFAEFCQKSGFEVAKTSKSSVFVKCQNPLGLAEAFSKNLGLLRPIIR